MELKIVSVHNRGDFDEEYVVLKAVKDCDIGHYMLADSTYTDSGALSNKLRHTYWFPNKKILRENYVSVWTKSGKDTKGEMKDGTPIHRHFWNLKTAVWNNEGDCAVLIHTPDWQHFKVGS